MPDRTFLTRLHPRQHVYPLDQSAGTLSPETAARMAEASWQDKTYMPTEGIRKGVPRWPIWITVIALVAVAVVSVAGG